MSSKEEDGRRARNFSQDTSFLAAAARSSPLAEPVLVRTFEHDAELRLGSRSSDETRPSVPSAVLDLRRCDRELPHLLERLPRGEVEFSSTCGRASIASIASSDNGRPVST